MKIWVITQEWDGNVDISVANTLEEANRIAREAQDIDWGNSSYSEEERPETWEEAYEMLLENDEVENWIQVEAFDVFPPAPTDPVEKAYVEAADRVWGRDGEIEIDEGTIVSISEDGGAYVQAWVWVYADQAGLCGDCCTMPLADGRCECEEEEDA